VFGIFLASLLFVLLLFAHSGGSGQLQADFEKKPNPLLLVRAETSDRSKITPREHAPTSGQIEFEEMGKKSTCANPGDRCTWERTFGGALQDKAYGISRMEDDGVVVVGNSRSVGGFGYDAWIIRLDRAGNLIWERDFGGLDSDQVYAVATTVDGGVVVAGHTRSKGAGKSDFWVFRLDKAGNFVWERTFGGEQDDRARTVTATEDGGFVVAGFTKSQGSSEGDAWVLKLVADGELSWESKFGSKGSDGVFNVSAMADGSLVATGYTNILEESGYDLWVIRLGTRGELVWERIFNRGVFDAGTAIVPTGDGGSVVVGVTSADGFQGDDAWVLKLSGSGELVWEKTFGGSKVDGAWSVVNMLDGGYGVVVATSSYGAGSADAWLLHLDGNGLVTWERVYGGKLWDRPTAAVLARDGGLLVAGYTTTQGAGYEDYWLLRLDSQGRF
jgi:uncharacterized delta-60 repeat protein